MGTERQQQLVDLISYANQGFSAYEKVFLDLEKAYFAEWDEKTLDYLKERNKSNIYFPKAQAKCKRVSDSLNKAYFANDKFVSIDCDKHSKEATALEKECRNILINNRSFFEAMQQVFYSTPYLGTGVIRSHWNSEKDTVEFQSIHLKDFRFDPDAQSRQDSKYYTHSIYLTIEDIKKLQRSSHFNRAIKIEELVSEDEAQQYTRVKLTEIYTKVNNQWKVSTVYEDVYFLRQDVLLNDGSPFDWGGLIPQMQKLNDENYVSQYFEPIIASILPIQQEFNIRKNQTIDAIKQQLNPRLITPISTGINPLDLEKPTGHIKARSTTGVIPMVTADPRIASFDIQILDHDMSENTGVSPMMNGVSNDKSKTATEKGIEHSEGSLKLEIYIRTFNESFFEPLMTRVAKLVWKYSNSDVFDGLNRDVDFEEFNIRINTGLGVTNDVIKAQQHEMNFAGLGQLFQMAMATQNLDEAKRIYEGAKKLQKERMSLSGIKNADEYLGEDKDERELTEFNDRGFESISEQPNLVSDENALIGQQGEALHGYEN
jgi:hypothetical protein